MSAFKPPRAELRHVRAAANEAFFYSSIAASNDRVGQHEISASQWRQAAAASKRAFNLSAKVAARSGAQP